MTNTFAGSSSLLRGNAFSIDHSAGSIVTVRLFDVNWSL
jgi:hypothetical protein